MEYSKHYKIDCSSLGGKSDLICAFAQLTFDLEKNPEKVIFHVDLSRKNDVLNNPNNLDALDEYIFDLTNEYGVNDRLLKSFKAKLELVNTEELFQILGDSKELNAILKIIEQNENLKVQYN